jgi:drug/metabolite transporter (DMT)-like permease
MPPTTTKQTNEWVAQNTFLVMVILLLVDSLHFVFARLLHPYLPPAPAALYVLGLATLETALYMAATKRIEISVFLSHKRFFLAIGFLVALATTLSYASVAYIDPGTASLLARTGTLFALGFSLLWLKEHLSRGEWIGAGITLLGVFIISFQPGDIFQIGALFILGSTFAYALHAAIVKKYGGEMEFSNFFLFRVASTTAFLLLFTFGQAQFQLPPSGPAWLVLLLTATVDVVISRVLYYLSLRQLQMSFHSLILTLSPVIAVFWSFLLFGVVPSVQGVIGGTAVLCGVLIVTMSKRKKTNRR